MPEQQNIRQSTYNYGDYHQDYTPDYNLPPPDYYEPPPQDYYQSHTAENTVNISQNSNNQQVKNTVSSQEQSPTRTASCQQSRTRKTG